MKIGGIIKAVLNKCITHSYWYNNIVFGDCQKFWNHRSFNLDVVNLGSSSALAAFDYSNFQQIKTANWAMAPQPLVADYEILRNYSCYLNKGATVIIPLCPFSCLGGCNDFLPDKYYTVLNIASMPHASFYRKQQQFQLKQNPWRYYPIAQLFSRKPNSKCVDEDSFDIDAKMRMEGWKKEFSIIRYTDPLSLINKDSYNDGVELLRQIIDYCIEREFKPVVVIPPVSHSLSLLFTKEMKALYIDDFIKKALSKEVRFFDYFDNKLFDNSHFKNSFILNKSGAQRFTDIILKEIGIV